MQKEMNIKALIEETTPIEHRQKILKGLIAKLPVVGSIITEYLPNTRFKKMTEFLLQLDEELEKLEKSIDEKYVKREEIACIIENIFRAVNETYDKDKLVALKNGLINTLIRKDIEDDRKYFYLDLLNNLTPMHIRVLSLLYQTEEYIKQNSITLSTNATTSRLFFFREALPDITEKEIELITFDLKSKGLIQDIGLRGLQSQAGINALKGFESEFGKKFMEFWSNPK
jgi:NurA-like 5'-3' nuclease